MLVLDEPTAALFVPRLTGSSKSWPVVCARAGRPLRVAPPGGSLRDRAPDHCPSRRPARGTWLRAEQSLPGVVAQMVGEAVDIRDRPSRKVSASPLLRVKSATGHTFRDVDLDVRPGEVLGLTGLAGSGHEELSATLFGAAPLEQGAISWKGRPFRPRHPDNARARGIAYVPPDRRRQGLVQPQGITENLTLASLDSLTTAGWINQGARRRLAETWCRRFEFSPPSTFPRA